MFPKNPSKIRDHETPPERAWERLMSAHAYGDCLITMSSSEKGVTDQRADELGLITGHAYAVLNVMQTRNGTRLLQLKNPWAHKVRRYQHNSVITFFGEINGVPNTITIRGFALKGWKGRFSCYDTEGWSDPAFRAEVGYNPELAMQQDDGVSWICWEDALVYYQNIHLSWNPALFSYRSEKHGFWRKEQGPSDDTFNCGKQRAVLVLKMNYVFPSSLKFFLPLHSGENPQYVMKLSERAIKKGATLWILVSRHVTKQEQEGCEVRCFSFIML